jgi:hypothetical protein
MSSSAQSRREVRTRYRSVQLEDILRCPTPNPPVNKPDLSTRETGEFAGDNAGFGLNPGG